MVDTAAAGSL